MLGLARWLFVGVDELVNVRIGPPLSCKDTHLATCPSRRAPPQRPAMHRGIDIGPMFTPVGANRRPLAAVVFRFSDPQKSRPELLYGGTAGRMPEVGRSHGRGGPPSFPRNFLVPAYVAFKKTS